MTHNKAILRSICKTFMTFLVFWIQTFLPLFTF